jgi:flagellar protein FlaG
VGHTAEVKPVQAVEGIRREPASRSHGAKPTSRSENARDAGPKAGAQTHVGFSVHKDTGTIVMKIVDNVSREVLRQIPPEERLKLAARFKKTIGLLFE